MAAGVAGTDRGESRCGEFTRGGRLVKDEGKLLFHFPAITSDKIVFAGTEQVFRIVPRRADQRDAASKRLENPDRRNARQRLDIGPARDVDRHAVAGEHLWHVGVRNPTAISDTSLVQRREGSVGVTDSVYFCVESEVVDRLDQEPGDFVAALAIAPVANPDEVALPVDFRQRMEQGGVCRLVPGDNLPAPAGLEVSLAQSLAEGEHEIVVGKIEGGDFGGG